MSDENGHAGTANGDEEMYIRNISIDGVRNDTISAVKQLADQGTITQEVAKEWIGNLERQMSPRCA